MPSRGSPTEQIRASIDALFADPDRDLGAVLEDVARLSVRLVFQDALEAEMTQFLGRDRYAVSVTGRVCATAIATSQ